MNEGPVLKQKTLAQIFTFKISCLRLDIPEYNNP